MRTSSPGEGAANPETGERLPPAAPEVSAAVWEKPDCVICGGGAAKKIVWEDRAGGNIVRCRGCGLVFRSPRRTENYLSQHFKEEWTELRPDFYWNYYWEKNCSRIARQILQRLPGPASILDVGCSYGRLLHKFPDTWRRVGLEPSRLACEVARQIIPEAHIINGTLIETHLPERSFDVITLVDMVYYLSQPVRDLAHLREWLKPGGLLVVEAQNFANRGLIYRLQGRSFLDNIIYFYTPRSLTRVLGRAGLKVTARRDLPGHRVTALKSRDRWLAWLELYFWKTFKLMSGGKVDLTPHFLLVGQAP